jgi:hypothetical protein
VDLVLVLITELKDELGEEGALEFGQWLLVKNELLILNEVE